MRNEKIVNFKTHKTIQKYFFWIVIFLIIAIAAIIYFNKFHYPYGWDAGYYINRVNSLIYNNETNYRVGYVFLSAIIQQITGLSQLNIQLIVPFTLLLLFILNISILLYRMIRLKFLLVLTLALLLLSSTYFYLSISLFDNLFALVLFSFILNLLADNKLNGRLIGIVPIFVILVAIGLTHLETYIFTIITIFVFIFLSSVTKKRGYFWKSLKSCKYIILPVIFSLIIVYLFWQKIGINIMVKYSQTMVGKDASVNYVQVNSRSLFNLLLDITNFFKPYFGFSLFSLLFIFGVIFIIFKKLPGSNSKAKNALLAWLISSYLLVSFSIIRGGIPVSRAVLFIPTNIFIIIGVLAFYLFIPKFKTFSILIIIIFLNFFISYTQAIKYQNPPFEYPVFEDLVVLKKSIKNLKSNGVNRFVIVTNTPSYEKAANAFYEMWSYWINATLVDIRDINYCIYFGNYHDVINKNFPTVRSDNAEYNDVSQKSSKCLNILDDRVPLIILKKFAIYEFDSLKKNSDTILLSEYILFYQYH